MIFRHESPRARVGRVMAVIAHHEVIVVLERVGVCLLAVNIYLAIAIIELVPLVILDAPLVSCHLVIDVAIESDGGSSRGNPERPVGIARPTSLVVQRVIVVQSDRKSVV